MTGTSRRLELCAGMAAAILLAQAGHASGKTMNATSSNSFDAVVDNLRSLPNFSRGAIERATGARLTAQRETGLFSFYEARDVEIGGVTVGLIDYREPRVAGTATAGPLLRLKLAAGCPKRQDIEARYGPLKITGAPRGRSLDEETQLSTPQAWGQLTFGFAERTPDCLTSVIFAAGARDPG